MKNVSIINGSNNKHRNKLGLKSILLLSSAPQTTHHGDFRKCLNIPKIK